VVIGGGVGIPPLIYLAEALCQAHKRVVAFSGARTGRLLPLTPTAGVDVRTDAHPTPCVEEFARFGAEAVLATDDGSLGFGGFVSNAFAEWLRARQPWPEGLAVYTCGPEPLMKAVADLCLAHGIACQLAMERYMACGMGTCQSCVVKVRDDTEQGWSFKLCCTDGPVFDARDLLW
jgi:dihydroorotate dehydrogenase electron transfer subunit